MVNQKDGDNELLELDNPNASTTAKNIAVLIFENGDTNNDPVRWLKNRGI